MNTIKIKPSKLIGDIQVPPSKSITHRAIICAGLSKEISRIDNIILSQDIMATLEGMKSFGAIEVEKIEISNGDKVISNIEKNDNNYSHTNNEKFNDSVRRRTLYIKGTDRLSIVNSTIDCIESGSTLRFLIPIGALINEKITFTGRGKLISRPLDEYYKIFDKQQFFYTNDNKKLPLTINDRLTPGDFKIRGDISSQFITGLMFALPLLDGDSRIILTTELESKGYVDLTMDILREFSIEIQNNEYKEFYIKGNQSYKSRNYKIEGDFSQAAFWLVAGLLGERVKCLNINIDSLQGDKEILNIIKHMNGNIKIENEYIETANSQTLGTTIDASQCPDLVPIVAALGAVSKGTTEIINAKRLRIKESDRLKAMATELNKLGADVTETEDGLIIKGKDRLRGGEVDSWNDHRIAMALAVVSSKCTEEVIITNAQAVKKSYPGFWQDFEDLGGNIEYV